MTARTEIPVSVSELSYTRLVRLQRVVESTRRALRARFDVLPAGTRVRYWGLPQLTEYGFQGSLALQVWYRDSTLRWGPLGGSRGLVDGSVVVEYVRNAPWPAKVVEPRALRLLAEAADAMAAYRETAADSLLMEAERAQPGPPGPFDVAVLGNRAILALDRNDDALAYRLNQTCLGLDPGSADAWALDADLALRRGDQRRAVDSVRRCLRLKPNHVQGKALEAQLSTLR